MNEMEYVEIPVARIDPDWTSNNLGTHTYSRTDEFEVIDGKSMVMSKPINLI